MSIGTLVKTFTLKRKRLIQMVTFMGESANWNHPVKCIYTHTIIETTSIVIFPSLGNGELSVQT